MQANHLRTLALVWIALIILVVFSLSRIGMIERVLLIIAFLIATLVIVQSLMEPPRVEPERVLELEADHEMMNWLDQNIFHVEPDDWTARRSPELTTWRIFAPKGARGSARRIISAAMERQRHLMREAGDLGG